MFMKQSKIILFSWIPVFFAYQTTWSTPLLTSAISSAGPSETILGKYSVDPANVAKSLLFDQEFDSKPLRPAPLRRMPARSAEEMALVSRHAPELPKPVEVQVEVGPALHEDNIDFHSLWEATPGILDVQERPLATKAHPAAFVAANSVETRDKVLGALAVGPADKIETLNEKISAQVFQVPEMHLNPPRVGTQSLALHEDVKTSTNEFSVNLPKNIYRKGGLELLVIDEESFLEKKPKVISKAQVFWGHSASAISTESNNSGRALPPNARFASARFVVKAEGYLPAVGYATRNMITPVILIKEKRLGAVLKSLNVTPAAGKTLVWGKFLSDSLEGQEKIQIESSDPSAKAFYSIGSFGLFHPKATSSGPQGDFLVSALPRELHYLLPSESRDLGEVSELPPALLNLAGLGPIITTTIVQSKSSSVETQVVDGLSLEKPETSIYATVGGQRGMFTADEDGFVNFKGLPLRNQVDLVEVRASGYLKSWINAPANGESFPELVSLFNRAQLNELLQGSGVNLQQSNPVILGQLRPEAFKKKYAVEILDSNGISPEGVEVVYFDQKNRPNPNQNGTDRLMQTFAVLNLAAGEYHLVIRDVDSHQLVSMQVVRCADSVLSQVQF
jgi:hypothetical protein